MFTEKTKQWPWLKMALISVLYIFLSACTSTKEDANDPFEPVNRAVFSFNAVVDDNLTAPVARGYRSYIPQPVRFSVRNILRNLRSPVNIANQFLQGDLHGGGSDTARAIINTTVGIGGIWDPASRLGLDYEFEDLGQTFRVWGLKDTPYLVLPFLGPGTIADHTGSVVEGYADPLNIYLNNIDEDALLYTRLGVSIIDAREALLDPLDNIRAESLDYYAAVRSTYEQNQVSLSNDHEPGTTSTVEIPDYDDEPL